MFSLKTLSFVSPPAAFSHRLHGPHRRGSSQSRAEQGGVQRATPAERDLYSTEQVRGLMSTLVSKSAGRVASCQQGGECAHFKMGFPGGRLPVCLLRIGSENQPTTKVETHMKEDEQSDKEALSSVAKL